MRIEYGTTKFKKQCDPKKVVESFGKDLADGLNRRSQQMLFAPTLKDFRAVHPHCEDLSGDMAGEWSARVSKNWRVIFEIADDPIPRNEHGGVDEASVVSVRLLRLEDYH